MRATPDSTLADPKDRLIADLQRQLAASNAERDEALAQQTATAEVLQVINSSPGDLAPVFDAMIEKAVRLCGAAHGTLRTFDGEAFHLAAMAGEPEVVARVRQTGPIRPHAGNPFEPLARGERIIHISDARELPGYREFAATRERIDAAGVRTWLVVALHKEDALVGAIAVFRQEVRPFSVREIALLENFAAQAVIAMENARLLTETREALAQQTATAEILSVINNALGELTPVFDAMLDRALRLCEGAFGTLFTYEDGLFHQAATRNRKVAIDRPFSAGPQSAAGRLVRGERLVHIADARDSDAYRSGDPSRVRIVDVEGARSYLAVPMRKGEVLLGLITIYRQEVRPFTDKQIALLENFAAQAVIAMENARLLNELQDRTRDLQQSLEYQTATSDVLKVISRSGAEIEAVLETLVETATRLCQADFGLVFRLQDGRLHLVASCGAAVEFKEYLLANPVAQDRGSLSGRVTLGRRVVHIEDAANDPEYTWAEGRQIGNLRTGLGVPLLREDTLIGIIILYRTRVERFSEKQIALVTTFADQAVIAIENARLLGELRQRTEEVAELNRGLEARVAEQVEELGRVGRLKRFLAPQLAELIVSQGDEKILESHRREIVVVFCDLRGYTAFTETAEPEEVLDFLREYHGALGPLVAQFEGTLDQFSGDGIMVFFNDPVPIPEPAERAVRMAVAMREAASTLITAWHERGRELGFGVGISQGYATLGQIGFAERSGYTAIGTVCNVAARLCAEAKDGQILLSQRVNVALKGGIATEQVGALALKGLTQPVVAYNVPLAASQPALRVIEGGPQNV